jgi:hypothetical protein
MFVANENGEFFCCHLPADFCAEHEWGIRDLARTFGLVQYDKNEGPLDVTRFQIQEVPQPEDGLILKLGKEHHFLVLDTWEPERQTDHEHWLSPEVSKERFDEKAVSILPVKASGKWDSKGFAIYVKGKDVGKYLQELHQAILNKDFAIMLGRGHAFQNGGLNLTIISKMPKAIKDTIAEELKDSRELKKAADATGIYQIIVMSLKGDRDYDRKIWPQTPNKQTIRGPGKIVFDFCEKEGLMPTIEYWHDGMGLESGYNIIVRWN